MRAHADVIAEVEALPDGPRIGAFFDFDGTIIAGYSATAVLREQIKRRELSVRQIVESARAMATFGIGSTSFSTLMMATTQFMRGIDEAAYRELGVKLFEKDIAKLIYPESRALIEVHLRKGHTVAIISSATEYQIEPAALSPLSTSAALRAAVQESEAAYTFLQSRGYIDEPLRFHATPPPIMAPALRALRIRGHDCEQLCFASEHEPDQQLPGRDRWLSYTENRTSHEVLLRRQQPAPWLVCVHGFGMGKPAQDFQAFRAAQLHQRAGLNVAFFTLPAHGPRAPAGFNGAKFFGLSIVDFLHAESQAVWDLRRLIAWIRTQQATQVGVFGISLGAYTSAVLSAVEPDLACVIAHREYLASTAERRLAAIAGVDAQRDRAVHSVVSPLHLPTQVPHSGRYMFAATGDQFVPIEQVRALWLHWDRPRISWCRGGHQSALLQRQPRTLVDAAVEASFSASRNRRPGQ